MRIIRMRVEKRAHLVSLPTVPKGAFFLEDIEKKSPRNNRLSI
jgi:hypothetical protein